MAKYADLGLDLDEEISQRAEPVPQATPPPAETPSMPASPAIAAAAASPVDLLLADCADISADLVRSAGALLEWRSV